VGHKHNFHICDRSADSCGQPQVRETSRRGWWARGKGTAAGTKSLEAVKRDFSDVVLPKALHDNVRSLAAVTANTRQHGAPFRHMMFYGETCQAHSRHMHRGQQRTRHLQPPAPSA